MSRNIENIKAKSQEASKALQRWQLVERRYLLVAIAVIAALAITSLSAILLVKTANERTARVLHEMTLIIKTLQGPTIGQQELQGAIAGLKTAFERASAPSLKSQLSDLLARAQSAIGAQPSCPPHFVADQVSKDILAAIPGNEQERAPRIASVCQAIPESLVGGAQSTIVEFMGYNLDAPDVSAHLAVSAVDTTPLRVEVVSPSLIRVAVSTISTAPSAIELLQDDAPIARIPVLRRPPEEAATPTTQLSYTPPHVRGDRDFKGHGPTIVVRALVRIGPEQRTIEGQVYMLARETKPDWTTAEGWLGWRRLWTAPSGKRIVKILSPTEDAVEFVATGHGLTRTTGRSAVQYFECTGDTRGDEAGIRTGVTVVFNPIRVLIEDAPG